MTMDHQSSNIVFPDVCLLMIFEYLPAQDLVVNIPLVCRQWHRLHLNATQVRRRLSLVVNQKNKSVSDILFNDSILASLIFDQAQPQNANKTSNIITDSSELNFPDIWSRLYLPTLTRKQLIGLSYQFPHVESLEIVQVIDHPKFYRILRFLFNQWKNSLVKLSIWTLYTSRPWLYKLPPVRHGLRSIIKYINSHLKHLRHLLIVDKSHIGPHIWPTNQELTIDLKVLKRLHGFCFYTKDPAYVLLDSFLRYATFNPDLKSIMIGSFTNISEQFDTILHFDEQLASRISYINLRHKSDLFSKQASEKDIKDWEIFLTKYANLIGITIDLTYQNFMITIRCLSQLPNIKYCHLLMNLDLVEPLSTFDRMPSSTIPQMLKLEQLRLTIPRCDSHDVLQSRHLATMFPNLKFVQIKFVAHQCLECGYFWNKNSDENYSTEHIGRFKQCTIQFANQWFACPQLKAIELVCFGKIKREKLLFRWKKKRQQAFGVEMID
ncbi:hypothetical protein BLOT_016531 [Blomia tropicalis]|nr:hypothetical protein BLOT_016531 [Blomia tropicalis]